MMQSLMKTSLIGALAAVYLTLSSGARSDDSHMVEVDVHEGHTSSSNTSAVAGATLNEKCYFKDPECPPGAYKGHSPINGDYCQCHGKVAMIADQRDIQDSSSAGFLDHAKEMAARAKASARCVASNNDFQKYWFKLKDGRVPEANSKCICSGIEGVECLSTTVALHVTTNKPAQSKLTCDEVVRLTEGTRTTPSREIRTKQCKIGAGSFCSYSVHSTDCVTDRRCGAISQRCVDDSTYLLESEIKAGLASSLSGSNNLKGMAEIAMIVGQLASKSVSMGDQWEGPFWKQLLANQKQEVERLLI